MIDSLQTQPWCVLAAAPAGTYRLVKDTHKDLVGHQLCDCLMLDEACQMNLPEAVMAALLLKDDGQLIVVVVHDETDSLRWNPFERELLAPVLEVLASRSVFQLFSSDEETFAHAQLWKNLLRTTCTARLWEGTRGGRQIAVWGNGHRETQPAKPVCPRPPDCDRQ